MTKAPRFWAYGGGPISGLGLLSVIYASAIAHRMDRPAWRGPVPVICCGNATVGGAGKTTLVHDLAGRLRARGIGVHILLRGYLGSSRGTRRVSRRDAVAFTGDEALLLSASAPTWTGANREASARAAIAAGARVILMDDGLQNPSLAKSMSFLVIHGATGFGNGWTLPAGPLREPVLAAASRCRAAVLIGPDTSQVLAQLPPNLRVLRATLEQSAEVVDLIGRRVVAFAGIADPDKFFSGLEKSGVVMAGRQPFPDHHSFTSDELARLVSSAEMLDALLVTTPKDAVRLPVGVPVNVIGVRLVWEDEAAIEFLLNEFVAG